MANRLEAAKARATRRLERAAGVALVGLGLALVSACGQEANTTAPHELGAGGSTTTTSTGGATTTTSSVGGQGASAPQLGPPYPIVLAHGFFGFNSFAGIDFIDYFYHVKDFLALRGEMLVFTPTVDPFNSTEFRAAQLEDKISQILRETGYAKVNIIGHSQGGLDARLVAYHHPEWIASVVTVATPHRGSIIADIALKIVDHPLINEVLDFFLQTVGKEVWDEIGQETDLATSLHSFTLAEAVAFNESYPDQPSVYYASVAGRTNFDDGGTDCQGAAPDFIMQFESTLDPVDPLLWAEEQILSGGIGSPVVNDGLVPVTSARWGHFLGCVPADHIDEPGQILGDSPGIGNDWDYKEFYADLVALIRQRGF